MMYRPIGAVAILCALIFALSIPAAEARPRHKTQRHVAPAVSQCVFDNSGRQVCGGAIERTARHARVTPGHAKQQWTGGGDSGFSSSSLVSEARKYLGTNPTGRARLWCGAFMDLVLRRTGHAGGGNLAKAYANYGTRVSGPQVGAIAVMGRKGGGHVGVVSGIDANGNPIIISGNHNRTTAESVYPASRIIAYVMPRQ